jgi:histidinol-phosphate phosphatase family protein
MATHASKSPAVFLDRDGVIIEEKQFQTDPDTIEFIPGSLEGLSNLKPGFIKVVVSNQSGVARGYFSEEDVVAFNQALDGQLRRKGIEISGWYYCPHGPDDACECRKPRSGMFRRAAAELPIDLARSWIVGDKSSDVAAGEALGMKTILVGTGYGGKEEGAEVCHADFAVDNLFIAVEIINKGSEE